MRISRVLVLGLTWPWVSSAPALAAWTIAGRMQNERAQHSATVLSDGRLLVVGGYGGANKDFIWRTAEVYEPTTGAWAPVAQPAKTRAFHTATLLANGKVLLIGGLGTAGVDAELYDPATDVWTTSPTGASRSAHTATLLQSGNVLVVGGQNASLTPVATVQTYNPSTGAWTSVNPLGSARMEHTATLLPNGKVLVVGGRGAASELATAELFDPATGNWTSAGTTSVARKRHSATLLPDGRVLVAGGYNSTPSYSQSAEIYNPALNSWTSTGSLPFGRAYHTASLLPNGKVLVAGGGGSIETGALYDTLAGTWTVSNLGSQRREHTATLLPTGEVLIVGGWGDNFTALATAERYRFPADSWMAGGSLNTGRYAHSTTLLRNGLVLVAGGVGSGNTDLTSAELYNPATNTWTPTGSLNVARSFHSATLLSSGRVLVVGGQAQNQTVFLSSAELYDPSSGGWTLVPNVLSQARSSHTASVLPGGKVLIAGGRGPGTFATTAIYDPSSGANGSWSAGPSMLTPRQWHTATLLRDGRVLLVGGLSNGGVSAELYDPIANSWAAAAATDFRSQHTATLLPTGKVLVAGGGGFSGTSVAEVYDPSNDSWSLAPSMLEPRTGHSATVFLDGRVLVAGGQGPNGFLVTQLYDALADAWSTGPALTQGYNPADSVLLADGRVLLAGGIGSSAVQIFTSESVAPSRRPVINTLFGSLSYGSTLNVTGSFRGDSEASGGTYNNSAANVPLVELRSLASGELHRLVPEPRANFSDSPMTLTLRTFPASLNSELYGLRVVTDGIASAQVTLAGACGFGMTAQPSDQTGALGSTVTFSVRAQGARRYQWQRDPGSGVFSNISGANGPDYVSPPVTALDAGSRYRALVYGGCSSATSGTATLRVADAVFPLASVVSPSGGEYWLLAESGSPAAQRVVTWSMSDDIRICRVEASLLMSNDGGGIYGAVPNPYNLTSTGPAIYGPGGVCTASQQVTTTSLLYSMPAVFPSGTSGSLYKVEVRVTDHAGNQTTRLSANPFYIVQANPDSVRTLILKNTARMQTQAGVSAPAAAALDAKLVELSNHPRVQGFVVDVAGITSVAALYAAWDADPGNAEKANAVLFGCHAPLPAGCTTERDGIHDTLRTLLNAYTGVKNLVLVGDDRIIPFARLRDRTRIGVESDYPNSPAGDLSAATSVGKALAAGLFLSDDPLAVLDQSRPDSLNDSLYIPDLSVGRLVETPAEVTKTITTFIGQDGVLDLTASTKKVLITGYDFLLDSAEAIRERWRGALQLPPGDTTTVDTSLLGQAWGTNDLRTKLQARYSILSLNGHATHYAEGVPGPEVQQVFGLNASDLLTLDLSGLVAYGVGCHGGLPVPGSTTTAPDHSLDLPQTFLSRGVVSYVANTGYGSGLKNNIGYGERLTQLLTEKLTEGGTVVFGDAVRRSKLQYFLETPRQAGVVGAKTSRLDPYDEKALMQWALYGLPMYAVKTGIAKTTGGLPVEDLASASSAVPAPSAVEGFGPVRVERRASDTSSSAAGDGGAAAAATSLPPYLTEVNLSFDFTAPGVYRKRNSSGQDITSQAGCPDAVGCYYTLNGLVERATGATDLPVQPYFIYDSRLSGTSQHGVLWKGGTYEQESNFPVVVAEIVSNTGDGSNHGVAPLEAMSDSIGPRWEVGKNSDTCRSSDLEVNSIVVTAGEALKAQASDSKYTIERTFRRVDLEVFYFNNTRTGAGNCDRTAPRFGDGTYHQVTGTTVNWAVPVTDADGVWRVVAVWNDERNKRWESVELEDSDGDGVWRGSKSVAGSSRVTYVLQAVDVHGNVAWKRYETPESGLPSSGVQHDLPDAFKVSVYSARGDFNGDGKTDLLWRNVGSGSDAGALFVWLMNGKDLLGGTFLSPIALEWQTQGTGDFNGDGKSDILWRHQATGELFLWVMDGASTISGTGFTNAQADLGWSVQGLGDLNGDGKTDIVWRKTGAGVDTGALFLWLMDGKNVAGATYLDPIGLQWQIQRLGDFNGDGRSDILWRNMSPGQSDSAYLFLWLMNGPQVVAGTGYTSLQADSGWSVQDVGDFDGDGKSDILWRNVGNGADAGALFVWLMDGKTLKGGTYLLPVTLDWQVQGLGDFNGDGRADILWRQASTGKTYVWLMDGAQVIGGTGFTNSNADNNWQVRAPR
jgi:N-acetylneuraminic acid mutarotase